MRNLIYCNFQDPSADVKYYTEVADLDKLAVAVDSYLTEYNAMSKKQMNLVLFRYANIQIGNGK